MRGKKIYHSQIYSYLFSVTGTPGPLYTILPEKKVERLGKDIMASTHVYDLSKKGHVPDTVEVSLNPEDLDLGDQKGLEEKYEEQLRKQTRSRAVEEQPEEDLSDLVAKHNSEQNVSSKGYYLNFNRSFQRKRRVQDQKKSESSKKKFKF